MAGMSLLRPVLHRTIRASLIQQWQNGTLRLPSLSAQTALVRGMASHGPPKIPMQASRYEWNGFKDDLNLFLWIGLLPIGIVIAYANMAVGPAELRDIPEGYEPKHWEYHKGPIQRWFAKNIYNDPEKEYEKICNAFYHEGEELKMKKLEARMMDLMQTRADYKGWYYFPVDKNKVDRGRELYEDMRH
ncbi:hypothetical protein SNE40_015598 [Patella caerulea]|uniref:NADH dehydrogenase [ubiquinone] 1 beta subcomplex subunit 5, mitochondrial n=1 Tax=Patella caerulea TaxID=87958 RepID=A0AAN8PLC3_PATCE